ncbi:MAG: 50S ribosomal protein L19 [Armatimonadota bacterium]|jgi:large subunit ribosomal protein L19
MDPISQLEAEAIREDMPEFKAGDTVRVHIQIREGGRKRTQSFEGTVLRRAKAGLRENFTVRRISQNVGVERTFMLNSPLIDRLEVLRRGRTRRARLYYVRKRIGKSARVREADG